MPKQVTNEELARMIAVGFENTATKTELLEVKQELQEDLERIELRMNHLAPNFEVKDLKKRVGVLERKVGIK
jgi:chaperonin cofactor prefoldin